MFRSVNPATGEEMERYEPHSDGEVERRLARTWSDWERWRRTSLADRADLLRRVADGLEAGRSELAALMATEMGKPIAAAESEIDKCAWVCRHYADQGEDYLTEELVATEAKQSYVRFDPLGPILAIMPWNFPFWQLFRHASPAVMAGNAVVLKHAENVPGCALAIQQLFADAGALQGLVQTLLVEVDRVPPLIADDRVRAVTVTGSVAAGRAVARQAGEQLKKTVLELGGSDPFIVLSDADLSKAARAGATSRLINNGESCIAAKRFVVHASITSEFEERLTAEVSSRTVGDPLDRDTDVGPLARGDLRDQLHDQVTRSEQAGAHVLTGGRPMEGAGFFYEPTVMTGVDPQMAAGAEETFGPVAAIMEVDDDAKAVEVANTTSYGLGASVWTENPDRAASLIPRLEAGCVFVNELVKSDPRLPFGGIKNSGYGRELGPHGIKEFTNIKTVWIR